MLLAYAMPTLTLSSMSMAMEMSLDGQKSLVLRSPGKYSCGAGVICSVTSAVGLSLHSS